MFLICGVTPHKKEVFVIDTDDKVVEIIDCDMLISYTKDDGIVFYGASADIGRYDKYKETLSQSSQDSSPIAESCVKFAAPALEGESIKFIDVQVEPVVVNEQLRCCILSTSYQSEQGYYAEVGVFDKNGYHQCDSAASSTQRVTIRLRRAPTHPDYVMGELYRDESSGNLMHTSIVRYYEYGLFEDKYDFRIGEKE